MSAAIWPHSCFIQQTFYSIPSSPCLTAYYRLALAAGKTEWKSCLMHACSEVGCRALHRKKKVSAEIELIYISLNLERFNRYLSMWKSVSQKDKKFTYVIFALAAYRLWMLSHNLYGRSDSVIVEPLFDFPSLWDMNRWQLKFTRCTQM